ISNGGFNLKCNSSRSAFFAPSGLDVYSLVIPASERSSGAQCCFAAANNSCGHISLLTERGYLRLPVAINISPRWGEITKGVLLHFQVESTHDQLLLFSNRTGIA